FVRSAGTSGSAFSFTEIAHVVCGRMIVQRPSPFVIDASARLPSSVMMTICSRADVFTLKVDSCTPGIISRKARSTQHFHGPLHSLQIRDRSEVQSLPVLR